MTDPRPTTPQDDDRAEFKATQEMSGRATRTIMDAKRAAKPASPLSEERVREYEQMLDAVTPGPWTAGDGTEASFWTGPEAIVAHREDGLRRVLLQFNPNYPCAANARFIAAAPTIVAELLADCTALTARLEAVERERDELKRDVDQLKSVIRQYRVMTS